MQLVESVRGNDGKDEPSPNTDSSCDREDFEDSEEPFEKELCELWDMSMNADVAKFLQEVDATEFLLDVILKSKRARITEICVGVLGNMACCPDVCVNMMKNSELVDIITALLDENADTPILLETTRMIHVFITNNDTKEEWIKSLKKTFQNFIFILENSLNVELLLNCAHVVDSSFDSSDELLSEWVDSHLVTAVCEALKQVQSKQMQAAEALLHILQLVSTLEKGVEALVSCQSIIPMLCHFIAESGHDEGGIIVGRELSLTACFSVLNVILLAEPAEVLRAMEKDARIMKILMGLLGYSCKIHRKRARSSVRFSFSEDEKNGQELEAKAPAQNKSDQDNNGHSKEEHNDFTEKTETRRDSLEAANANADNHETRQTRFSTDSKTHDGASDDVLECDIHHQYFTVVIGLLKDILLESSVAPACVSKMLAPHEKMLEKIVNYARRINTYREAIQDLIDATLSTPSLHKRLVTDHHESTQKNQS
ncbi:predicted protein [Nematostella vectensis]|uniref:Protein saal1 n=2 Tax=Nematostella vectensis TaxID=45351 RepID=A7SYX9_NEMVE|nr:predicted protein [Nematostella vectensis]|eukprot:XP_001623192.1 predicted protein [Nematostella vectensis]